MRTPPPYTVSKLLRWRVKVLVSCFYTCNFPLEEESEARMPRENATVKKSKVGTTTSKQKANKKESESSSSRRRRRRRVVGKNKENGSVAGRTSFSDDDDEDFIVFCFRDDGEVDLVLPENKNDEAARNEKDSIGKVEEKQAATYTCNEITEKTREEEEESGEGREVSITASSDSNDHQSDAGSSGSFAFPIVQEKWLGSPVEMPRSSGGVRRPNNTCIHCCSF